MAIGAMTREYVAEASYGVAEAIPLLAAALPFIGHEAIRSRGTIGGSLAHADPAAELPAVARALDAEFVVRGPSGIRVIPAQEWFEGYLTTSRRPDELLVEVRFPTASPGTGVSFQEVADTVPLLAAALPLIGHEAIRSRGTIGGSLAHADPAAELPAVARALDAEFVVRGQSGERVIPAAQWFEGYLTTSRRPDELLLEVRFPTARRGTGVSFQEVARRHGDFAIVGLAVSLVLSGGVISDARLALAGVSYVPVRAAAAEDLLVGQRPSTELFDDAARRATDDIDPPADLHGSSDYRKTVAAAIARRGLRAAADNARERQ
jgi:CO/xanthine dehydrogenase FAD-binding subunit